MASKPTLPKGGQAIVIGKGGKVTAAPKAPKPTGKSSKPSLGKPVQRVNRARGRNGER